MRPIAIIAADLVYIDEHIESAAKEHDRLTRTIAEMEKQIAIVAEQRRKVYNSLGHHERRQATAIYEMRIATNAYDAGENT